MPHPSERRGQRGENPHVLDGPRVAAPHNDGRARVARSVYVTGIDRGTAYRSSSWESWSY